MNVHSDPGSDLRASAEGAADAGSLTVEQAIINLQQCQDLGLRYYAAWWLGKFRVSEPAAVEALIAALQDEADRAPDGGFPLRRNAARALGKLGDRRAVPALIDCLSCDDFHVREAAAQSLESLGDRSCISALQTLLTSDVGDCSGLGLAQPYDAILEALGTLQATAAIPSIQPFLDHAVPRVRYAAARAMYQLTQDDRYGELLVAALQGSDLQLRRSALLDLGASGYVAAAPAIAQAFAENSLKLIALKGLLEHQISSEPEDLAPERSLSEATCQLLAWMDSLL